MAQVSKTTRTKLENTREVAEAGKKHGPEATADIVSLAALLGVDALDASLINQYLDGLVALLLASREQLEQKEDALVAEMGDDAPLRAQRDDSNAEVRADMSDARAGIKTVGGEAATKQLGIHGSTPRTPDEVASFARSFEKRCREHGGTLEHVGMKIDLVALADQVAPKIDDLEQVIEQLVTESREEQLARQERDAASDVQERVYRGVAHILYGHLLLGGRDALAERVRPTERQVAGAEPVEPVVEPSTDDPVVEPVEA